MRLPGAPGGGDGGQVHRAQQPRQGVFAGRGHKAPSVGAEIQRAAWRWGEPWREGGRVAAAALGAAQVRGGHQRQQSPPADSARGAPGSRARNGNDRQANATARRPVRSAAARRLPQRPARWADARLATCDGRVCAVRARRVLWVGRGAGSNRADNDRSPASGPVRSSRWPDHPRPKTAAGPQTFPPTESDGRPVVANRRRAAANTTPARAKRGWGSQHRTE